MRISWQAIYLHPVSEKSQQLQPRTFTVRQGDVFTPLRDRHGNLVVIETPGTADFAGIAELGVEQWSEAFLWHIELRVLILDELSRRSGVLTRTCSVVDFAELNVKIASGVGGTKTEKEGFKAWQVSPLLLAAPLLGKSTPLPRGSHSSRQAVSKSISHAYPDTTYRNYVINAPGGWIVSQVLAPAGIATNTHCRRFCASLSRGAAFLAPPLTTTWR